MKKNMAKIRSAIKQGSRWRKDTFFFPELPKSSPFIPKLAVDNGKPCNIAFSCAGTDSPSPAFWGLPAS